MRQNDDGLMAKYIVHKAKTGETVNNCFVLRPDRDAAAVAAIRAYAAVTENRTLAADLIQWVGTEPNDPLTLEELREMDGEPVWVSTGRLHEWCIVHSCHSDDTIGGGVVITRRTAEKRIYQYVNYGKTWLAYRRRPEGSNG